MSAMVNEAETSTALHTNVTLLDKFRLGIEIINDSCNPDLQLVDVGGKPAFSSEARLQNQEQTNQANAVPWNNLTSQAAQPLGLKLDPERSGQANQGMLAADKYWLHLVGR